MRKFKTILLPCIVWAFGYYVIYVIRYRQFKSLSDFRDDILGANWFLWAIFYCSVICLIIVKFDKSLWKTSLFIIVLNFFIPDYYNLTGYKMIFPFILMGVLLKRYDLLHKFLKLKNIYQWIIIIFFVILYLAFYPWIGKEYAWEIFIHFDLGRLFMVLKRWGINFIGTVDGLLIMIKISEFLKKKINYNKNLILILGRNSLGIYMFQTFIYQYFYSKIMVNESWSIGIKCLYTFTVSLLVTIICLTCVLLVKKNRKLSVLLLGKG